MIIRAKYLLINPGNIVENGLVEINGKVIRYAGRFSTAFSRRVMLDLGESVIMPGLINPHTHLEGPELYGCSENTRRFLPKQIQLKPPQHFPEWALQVIGVRSHMTSSDFIGTVQRGYNLLAHNGITTVGDHTHLNRTWPAHRKAKLRRILFEETLNLNPLTVQTNLDEVKKNVSVVPRNDPLVKVGVAPHAPYTTSGELYKALFDLARKMSLRFSTHLSEMKEEIELLKDGEGDLLEFLRKTGRETPYWSPPEVSPTQYLFRLGVLRPPTFVVHCNYLSAKDLKLLVRSDCSVIFCPHSQRYFGHTNHPFRRLLRQGINVALGTDSLSSNLDLSILKEMKFIYENYAGLRPSELIKMGTLNGLKALGLKNKLGELKPGYEADIAVFPLRRTIVHPQRVQEYLVENTPQSILTMVAGQVIQKHAVR